MTYPFETMDPTSFQQLAAALAMRAIGPGIQPFGRGPDGGRDFIFHGLIPWSGGHGEPAEHWGGYTVFQVKHHAPLRHDQRDARWLLDEIKKELDAWANPDGSRVAVPDYLAFVSNVPLTAVTQTGGYDTVMQGIKDHLATYEGDHKARTSSLRAFTLWDGNKMETLVNAHPDVRWSFSGLLTAADVIGALAQFTQGLPLDQLEPALRAHARQSLMDDRYVYFDEAGGDPTAKTLLSDIAIDIPVSAEDTDERTMILRHVIAHGDRVLRLSEPLVPEKRHIILTGAPGNGKTTLSRFMAQVYRAAFHDPSTLVGDFKTVTNRTLDSLKRNNCALPTNRRWPICVNLAEYSEKYGQSDESNLLKWIAEQISTKAHTTSRVMAYNVHSWLRQWPWLLVLDGLDEVTAIEPRRRLIAEIESFIAEADQANADLLVVLTTRPTGLNEVIAPQHFRTFSLGQFTPAQALHYGKLTADVRLVGQEERRATVYARLIEASQDETLKHLMQTPLQVLIMSIILESSGSLPPDRFGLFDGFYDVVYKREANKQIPIARLLADNRNHVDRIHDRIGFELHVHSELADGLVAVLPEDRLVEIVRDELSAHGYEVTGAEAVLVDGLVEAARTRLVLVVPRDGGLGFEVRSLQELMAARYLATGSDDQILQRLRLAAPSPHWRNAWIFTAGRTFKLGQDHQRSTLVELVKQLDENATTRLARVCRVAPQLALDLVDDGLARQYPNLETELLRVGLELLNGPPPSSHLEIARSLVRAADRSARLKTVIANAFRAALSTQAASITEATQDRIDTAAKEMEASVGAASLRLVRAAGTKTRQPVQPNDVYWESFKTDGLALVSGSGEATVATVENALDELLDMHGGKSRTLLVTCEALTNPNAATALELLLEGLSPADGALARALRDAVSAHVWRRPIGDGLT